MTRAILVRFRPTAFSAWLAQFWSSRHNIIRLATLTLASGLVGGAAWSGNSLGLPLAIAFPALWSLAASRAGAALISATYFLGASRGLPEGASIFFGSNPWLGLLLWTAASMVFVGVHAACWTMRASWERPSRYLLANILMSVPPFGIVGWANPVTAAGILFPGWSWWGLALTTALLVAATTRYRRPVIAAIGVLAAWSATTWTDPQSPTGWSGIDTDFAYAREQYADYAQQLETTGLVRDAAANGAPIVALPESAFGIWTPTTAAFWKNALADTDVTIIGGAVIIGNTGYDNVMIRVTANGSEVLYRQRMPIPVSMWQPWIADGANADLFGNAAVELDGTRLAILLCYEQLLVWPVLHSMLEQRGVVVATQRLMDRLDEHLGDTAGRYQSLGAPFQSPIGDVL